MSKIKSEEVRVSMQNAEKRGEVLRLICRVRSGDEEAFEELLGQYAPLIEASVARFAQDELYSSYREDLRQEATLVFYNSIMTYDTEQGDVEFGLYARICISNALVSQLRVLKKRKAERLTEASDDGLFVNDSEDPSLRVLEQESLKTLYSVIRGNLSEQEWRIWKMYTSGKTARQIGECIGKDEKSVSNSIYRIRKKLRAKLQ